TNETCVIGQDNKDKQSLLKNKKDDRKKKSKLEVVDDSLEFIDLNTLPSDMTDIIALIAKRHQKEMIIKASNYVYGATLINFQAIMSTHDVLLHVNPGIDLTSENVQLDSGMGYLYLQAWNSRKICGFCNDDDDQQLGGFIGPQPFVTNTYTRH
ncbi:6220_t:CDS:2, partial [Racocetra persica]